MQDRPSAQELIEAVAGFLSEEIMPRLDDPRLRFRGLIAANVLVIVARELADGERLLLAEWRRLATLRGLPTNEPPARAGELRTSIEALNRELCADIRAGLADDSPLFEQIANHLRTTLAEKLSIANPRYLQRVMR